MTKAIRHLLVLLLVSFLIGCSSVTSSMKADYDRQVRSLKTIGVLTPDILMLELTAGGETERMDEWETAADQNMIRSVSRELASLKMKVKMIAPNQHPDLPEICYLNHAISESLNWNTTWRRYSLCTDPRVCRDYAVGQVQEILNRQQVDALLIVYGINEIESAKRASARKKSRAASFWIGVASPVTVAPLRNPGTYLSMSLVDRDGNVLWYSGTATGKGFDLRDQAVVDTLSKRILSRLSLVKEAE